MDNKYTNSFNKKGTTICKKKKYIYSNFHTKNTKCGQKGYKKCIQCVLLNASKSHYLKKCQTAQQTNRASTRQLKKHINQGLIFAAQKS